MKINDLDKKLYCIRCNGWVKMKDLELNKIKRGFRFEGTCSSCGRRMSNFTSRKEYMRYKHGE